MRHDLTFVSENTACAAWHYVPKTKKNGPRPILVMAHGLGGTRNMRLDAFAERFCAAGYHCLVFDYRFFGDSEGSPRQLLSIREQLKDWEAAAEFARTLEGADPNRVILWGSSFSGGHVMQTAAKLPWVAGSISQCPFTDGLASGLVIHPLSSLRLAPKILADFVAKLSKKPPVLVPLAGKPGEAALMTAPDCQRGYEAIQPGSDPEIGEVSARIGAEILTYFPGRATLRMKKPAFVLVCKQDTVAPARATHRHAAKLLQGTVKELDCGHFDIYVGEWFERTVALELEWLKAHFKAA